MPAASKSGADLEILQGHADRDRFIIVADDYSLIDTIHSSSPSVVHEWLVVNSRERLIELAEPPPFAVIVDLAARSMEAAEVEKIAGTWAPDKAAETLRSRMRATPDAVGVPKAHAIRTR